MPGRVDAVLLDLYDTIVWSRWAGLRDQIAARLSVTPGDLVDALERTHEPRGIGAYRTPEGSMAAVVAACGVEPEPELVAELTELERRFLADDGVVLYEDALPVVRQLRAEGVRTAVVSNCSHATRGVVDRLGLEGELDAVILSFEAGAMKPDPAIYLAALGRLAVPDPVTAVFVDDQPGYCDGAAALGMSTYVIVRPSEPLEGVPAEWDGHAVIRDLTPLLDRGL